MDCKLMTPGELVLTLFSGPGSWVTNDIMMFDVDDRLGLSQNNKRFIYIL